MNFILLTGRVRCPKVRVWCEYVQWTAENKQSDYELSVLARACRMAGSPSWAPKNPTVFHLSFWETFSCFDYPLDPSFTVFCFATHI